MKKLRVRQERLQRSALCLGVFSFFLAPALRAQHSAAPAAPKITITARTVLVVDAHSPEAIQLAAQDLASDMRKVFGVAPKIVRSEADAGSVAIVVGDVGAGASDDHATDPEAFSITSGEASLESGKKVQVVRLSGSDVRGTIFAIYQFSQEYLGTDPTYYWTDHEPAHRASIGLSDSLDERFEPPVFRYRGFFINDEDLLTGWAPGEVKDHTGISLDVWNKICETVLRLKGNMLVAGSWPFPNEPQDHVIEQRGLLLNQHHAEPLGVNFSRWPADVPYNFSAHPEYIENAWKNAVASYPKDQEILWEIGLRGLSDQPYSALDPSVKGDPKAEGHVISKAIAEQMRIVRAKYPKAVFITDLWMEGAKLMRSGDLVIPPDVITVWPDTGYGDMQDEGQVKSGQGAYIHVAMFNGKANQLSELTPVDKIFASLGRFQKAGATSFLLVNTSDIRPVTMGASAVLNFGWKGATIGDSKSYYGNWSRNEFGQKAASAVAEVYKTYFEAPAKRADNKSLPYGDNYYYTTADQLLLNTMVQWPTYTLPGQTPPWAKPGIHSYDPAWAEKQAELEIAACGAAQPRWDAVWNQALNAERLVDPARKNFYQSSVLTMIAINRESNRMLLALSKAVSEVRNGNRTAAQADARTALQAIDAIKSAEAKAEYGKWKNWYRGEGLVGVDEMRSRVADFAKWLRDPLAAVPPPVRFPNWEGYYRIQHYQGQRTVDVSPNR